MLEYFIYKNVENTNNKNNTNSDQPLVEGYDYYYRSDMNNRSMQRIKNENIENVSLPVLMLIFVLYIMLGIYAAKLSWYSNTIVGWSDGYKVLFSVFAFMFPVTYISAHIVFKMDLLERIVHKNLSKSKSKY